MAADGLIMGREEVALPKKIATLETCLATLHPEIAQEWHPRLNGELTPHEVTAGSSQKVWWLCPKGHSYDAVIANRTNPNMSRGCPICAGRRATAETCLATLYPEIAAQWHPHLNDDLTPQRVTANSGQKVWWRCPQGHDYEAVIASRTPPNPTGCPYCSGRRATAETCLANCYPEIAQEWHPHLNGDLTPRDVTAKSHHKAWWLCPQGHDYEARIANRTNPNKPTSCPYCAGKKVNEENCLATLYPEIAEEWHPDKNGTLTPQDVTAGTPRKVWWRCPQGHDYEARIASCTPPKPQGCPYCSGQRVHPDNCLATLHPEIAAQWHPHLNDDLTPQRVTANSGQKVWWLCPQGHDYDAVIASRTPPNPTGCPVCSGRRATAETCLANLYPEIAQEWHPSKNTLTPQEVMPGSGQKVWWLCPKGHDYEAVVHSRTPPQSSGCPFCTRQASSHEYRLLAELRFIFGYDEVRHRDKSLGKEVDLYLPRYRIAIEYDGSYYHQDKTKQDQAKRDHLHEQGVTLIRLRHHPLEKLSPHDIIHQSDDITKEDIDALLAVLKLADLRDAHQQAIQAYEGQSDFCNEDGYKYYLARFPAPPENESLPFLYPAIAQEWHPSKNAPLSPASFTPGSGQKVWWLCPQGHDYEAVIASRTPPKPSGCPYCAGKRVNEENCLATLQSEIAAQWHPSKNDDLTPHQVTPGSGQKVWWLCPKGHEWEAQVNSRTPPISSGCPYCAGQRVHPDNCLATLHPEIAEEWHPQLNGTLTPQDVTAGSNKKVWWQCPKGHDYEAAIGERTPPRSRGCPYCAGKKVHPDNCLATLYPKIAAQWHPQLNGELTPQNVTAKSGQKVWWLCPQGGHDYEARIADRTPPKPQGCPPFAQGGRCILIIAWPRCTQRLLRSGIPSSMAPSPRRMSPQAATKRSGGNAPRGMTMRLRLANAPRPGQEGCPYCAGKKVHPDNCLATLYPKIAAQWHPQLNGELTPQNVTAKSGQKVWWLCPQGGHDYEARIADRTPPKPQGCPVCAGRQVHPDNCLATLYPEIAAQWHPGKNDDLTPRDVTARTPRKAWWHCPQGHEWEARIADRTPPKPQGCPVCGRAAGAS